MLDLKIVEKETSLYGGNLRDPLPGLSYGDVLSDTQGIAGDHSGHGCVHRRCRHQALEVVRGPSSRGPLKSYDS